MVIQERDIEMKFVGFDIEIALDIPEGTDWKQCRPLGITCASLVSNDFSDAFWGGKKSGEYTPKMSVGEVQEMVMIMKALSPEYKIVTWNGLSFDFDVLAEESQMQKECVELAFNHIDIMFQFFCLKGFPVGISAVAQGCNIPGKVEGMHGDLAPLMWRNMEYERVIEYNIQDSKMALDIANYIELKKYLLWVTKKGQTKVCRLDSLLPVKECASIELPDQSWMTKPLTKNDYLEWTHQISPEG